MKMKTIEIQIWMADLLEKNLGIRQIILQIWKLV
jgi:hypothetical protein